MSDNSAMRDLFDRWELVWHEDRHDLVESCVAPAYLRHEAAGVEPSPPGATLRNSRR